MKSAKECAVPVVLSDGDVVFQPHKIRRSGLYDAFAGAVLVYVHKEFELEDVASAIRQTITFRSTTNYAF